MIGPGWMPSRPRPPYISVYVRRRPARRSPSATAATTPNVTTDRCIMDVMLFDGSRAELPIAQLRPSASQARHRVIRGYLQQWVTDRWSWVRPRAVPLIVAFVGMLGVLGATKYLPVYAYVEQPPQRAWRSVHEPVTAEHASKQAGDQIDHRGRSLDPAHPAVECHRTGDTTTFHP